jgi:hypothetical protein
MVPIVSATLENVDHSDERGKLIKKIIVITNNDDDIKKEEREEGAK